MIQMLIGPVAKIASTWVEGRVKKAEAKTRMKVAEAEAKAVIMEKKVTGEIDWDIEMAKSSDGSWKDEWLTVIFTLPLLLLMFGEYERVSDFFHILDSAPDWYQYLLGTIVAASFGFRGAAKFMGKK
tara:strand:- start:4165 stop:4545 length:381 start_codon:yes stop_codon:yes gene_type:complete